MPAEKTEDYSPEPVRVLKDSLIAMAVESWRLFKVLERLLLSLDAKEQQRYQSKFRWFFKKTEDALKSAGLTIVNYEGRVYDPGIPASPINLEDYDSEDKLYVTQMLEPVIVDSEGNVVKTGTIALGRLEK